jgi:hypothetical protein
MSITAITRPLPGERVLALAPQDAVEAAVTWLRRPNLFPGRALTAPTLEARSRWAAGHVAQRGQAFTPGVVYGLEVGFALRPPEGGEGRTEVTLHVAAGQGLAANGEDVVVLRDLEADLWALQVVAPPGVFEGGGFGGGGVLQPRAIGPTLGALIDERPDALPRAGVLVLQPALVDRAEIDPEDPCERCGCEDGNVSFEDWRFADAARLLWYAWPEDWRPMPPPNALLRNRLAYAVFDAERALPPDHVMPWEEFGVPVALLAVDADFLPVFSDRSSVVRRGGRARYSRLHLAAREAPGLPMATNARLPALWQAQFEQLAEHVLSIGDPAPTPNVLAESFDRLPPFGLLPTNVVDLGARRGDFFPSSFDLDAVPVPFEQLDLLLRESAGLAPVDLARGERLRVFVPVSQASYEPRLLLTEELDPEFFTTLDRFLMDRSRALAGRQSVRIKSSVLQRALLGQAPPVPAIGDDPQALEPETLGAWGPPTANGGHRSSLRAGLHEHGFADAGETVTPTAGDVLYAWVYLDLDNPPRELLLEWNTPTGAIHRAYWGENLIERGSEGRVTRLRIGDLPPTGRWVRMDVAAAAMEYERATLDGMGFVLFDGRAAFGPSGLLRDGAEVPWMDGALPDGAEAGGDEPFELLTANELLAPFEARSGVVPAGGEPPEGISVTLAELTVDPRITGLLSQSEQAQLPARGVEGFTQYLKARADRADDLVDYGFLKVQTDIYRVRQLVLNTTEATRLAVSPTLAGIAKSETAVASQENISTFFDRLRSTSTFAPGDTGGGTSPTGAPTGTGAFVGGLADASVTAEGGGSADSFSRLAAPLSMLRAPLAGAEIAVSEPTRSITETTFDLGLLSGVQAVSLQSISEPLVKTTSYTSVDITNATPLVGNFDLRTISVAERLQLPKAQEARDYSTGTRHEAVLGLVRLADELTQQDGEIPGLFEDIDVWGLAGDEFVPGGTDPVAALRRPLRDFILTATRVTLMAALLRPPVRETADEASHFSDSTDIADRTVALLRQVEGRIKRYRDAIAACQTAAGTLRKDLSAVAARERAWGETLGEARHDVAVTRALIAEEQARLTGVNERRAAVLAREVRFLAYARPRAADNLAGAPSRALDPGLLEAPVPACLEMHADVPDELRATLSVVREAPADWFRLQTRLLDGLNRVDILLKAVRTAQLRSQVALQPAIAPAPSTALLAAIGKVQVRQQQRVSVVRAQSLHLDIARLSSLTWQGVRAEAAKVVSLGDLIDGEHGQGLVARNAAAFFERFGRISGCLHEAFSEVLPSIRLDWAEILSEFDETRNLRNLAILPRWPEIEYEDRRRLQGLTDWLFDQLQPREQAAQDLVSDVVRMCLLLASHAPVGRIIAGRLPRPVVARPGIRIPLVALDPARLRVGMHALVYRGASIIARAVVEDLGQSEAAARVTYTAQDSVDLDENVRVQFADAAAVTLTRTATAFRGF